MIATPVSERLGIRYPVLQGGMAWISDASLAAAVSNGGGLGIIAGMNLDGEALRLEIAKVRALTSAPFGVNVMLMSPFVKEVAAVIAQEQVPVVTTGAGNPIPYMPAWLEAGIKVLPVIPSVSLAVRMARNGATGVIAEGCESGGHIGELTTMALVPQVCDAVDIPVIAAGGIADGRGVAAAFMLGAQGVQMGTRFLVAEECTAHPEYKARVLAARDLDTLVTGRRLGHPVRALRNRFSLEFSRMEADPNVTNEALEAYGSGALRRAAREGDVLTGSVMAGQIAGLVKEALPAAEIIERVMRETEARLSEATRWAR
jgi:enoyl-[acyl-carrier protein] reductase II